jgi:DNA-binding NarL/FixJ family response regulator
MGISVVLVEHPPAVRQTLKDRLSLEGDIEIVGEASDASSAAELAASLHPYVVLLDAEMPHLDARSTVRSLAARAPDCAIVIITLEPSRARGELPGVTVVGKHEGIRALLGAIRSAGNGQRFD